MIRFLKNIANSLYWKTYRFLEKNILFYCGYKKWNLVIFDNIFPHPQSGFRISEIGYLLKKIDKVKVISTNSSYRIIRDNNWNQKKYYKEFITKNTDLIKGNKIKLINQSNFLDYLMPININTSLFYCIFLDNIYYLLPYLEKHNIPFVFTLYPGGGFAFDNSISDERLKRVTSSYLFQKVIVNQKSIKDYLMKNKICNDDKIELIFGCSVPQDSINHNTNDKLYYPQKQSLDICFCAGRYTKDGADKGYPIFIEAMKVLSAKYNFVRFHVIGGYDSTVININGFEDKITFYGYRPFADLTKIYSEMDIIISPNQSNILGQGSFDGFPLGTLVEAALNGVLVMSCDPNNENTGNNETKPYFKPNQEIIIIKPCAKEVITQVDFLIENNNLIRKIGALGKKRFKEIYEDEYQMEKRISVIEKHITCNKTIY